MKSSIKETLPHSDGDEHIVLGSMMLSKDAIDKCLELLKPEDFYIDRNREVYKVIHDLSLQNKTIDLTIVASELKKLNKLELIGGLSALIRMIDLVTSAIHAEHHAQLVKGYSILRSLITKCDEITGDCYKHEEEPKEILERAEKKIFGIADSGQHGKLQKIGKDVLELMEQLENRQTNKQAVTGISSGLVSIDAITGGFQPGNLIIIGARPSIGKTSLAVGITIHNVIEKDQPIAFFSLEMNKQEIMTRMISWMSGINLFSLRTGYWGKTKWTELQSICEKIHNSPLYIDSTSSLTPISIRSACRRLSGRLKREGTPLGAIVIDYIQLMQAGRKHDNRESEVSDISRMMKGIGVDLQVPVIALSQLNRSPEERGAGGRPKQADLRNSGAIEQDADLVMLLWDKEFNSGEKKPESRVTVIIDKNRNGARGEVDLLFKREITRFYDLEKFDKSEPDYND